MNNLLMVSTPRYSIANELHKIREGIKRIKRGEADLIEFRCFNREEAEKIESYLKPEERKLVRFIYNIWPVMT